MDYYRFHLKGIVQGVGFRPYIFRKAKSLNLLGYVKNTGDGVEIVVNQKDFISHLDDLPALSKISQTETENIGECEFHDFEIISSAMSSGVTTIPADIAICKDCQLELRDKNDRRFGYYFITCTNCGPRFSMIEDYPYDRPLTAMNDFLMCKACKQEYDNPYDRRYYAQTVACKECGPKLRLIIEGKEEGLKTDRDLIKKAVEKIKSGEPIAIKGIGGFHIASLTDNASVKKVRDILKRKDKPFAIMAKDLIMAGRYAYISAREKEQLESSQRPIVVLNKKDAKSLTHVSEQDTIGIMLPYTPLQLLLFDFVDEPLVMTSCNISGNPISDKEILCDVFLTNDRKIINRCDDSVIKLIEEKPSFLRRSRGYVPIPITMPVQCKDTIALGAEMNNCICIAKDKNCYLSQYIGQTQKLDTFEYMKKSVWHFIKITRAEPKIIACDLHPEFNSSIYAQEISKTFNARLIKIQHHKAHVAGVAAEHGLKDYVGIAMDGSGFGDDSKTWGGEVFDVTDSVNFTRIGSLEEQPMIGGDSSAIYPKKMLFGILSKIMGKDGLLKQNLFSKKEADLYIKQLEQGFNVAMTTSSGRILDATSALLGFCDQRTYDGRPAMLLESHAKYPLKLKPLIRCSEGREIVDTSELFRFLLENKGKPINSLAATAQMYIAEGLFEIASKKGKPIVFSGGVAYNRMIARFMASKGVLMNREIPSGDGGICYGQAYLANIIASYES